MSCFLLGWYFERSFIWLGQSVGCDGGVVMYYVVVCAVGLFCLRIYFLLTYLVDFVFFISLYLIRFALLKVKSGGIIIPFSNVGFGINLF